jgi:hypothetical protein
MKTMQIFLTDELHRELKLVAVEQGKSMREIVVGWIGQRLVPRKTVPEPVKEKVQVPDKPQSTPSLPPPKKFTNHSS